MKKLLLFTIFTLTLCSCEHKNTELKQGDNSGEKPPVEDTLMPFTINAYIENSSSMDGYVKGCTEFEQAVYSYLSDIKISGLTDSLNLFYINSQIISQGSDIADFIEKLEPSTFKDRGGDRATSDIQDVLDTICASMMIGDVSILVTDGIFSPGKGKDASEYLSNQQTGIKVVFAEYIKKNPNAAVMVYRLSSNFNGKYYNNVDAHHYINEQRPFYIWIIGDAAKIVSLRNKISDDKLKVRSGNNIFNVFAITNGKHQVNYAINLGVGNFSKSRSNSKTIIENLKKNQHTSEVKFAVNVDFSDLLLDDAYLLDPNNYDNESNYNLDIKTNKGQSNKYTHTLYFSSDKVSKGDVVVKLKMKCPSWIDCVNDDSGETAIAGKTYGIKYQLEGVYEAFTFSNKYYTEIKITIK